MASSWGNSWGSSWGDSWGSISGFEFPHRGYNDLTLPFTVESNKVWNTIQKSIDTEIGEDNTITWTIMKKPEEYWNDEE